jgi:RHS repeat-associated protein
VTDPLGNLTQYAYDANGNLTSVTDANNHTTTYAYDAANRKISRTLPLGMTETFVNDATSNVTSHTDFRGKTATYTFDRRYPSGRMTSKVPDPSLGEPTVTYAYNPTSTRSSMTDASGNTTYAYDTRNRLHTKATPEGTLTYTYDASGNVASIDSSNTNGTSVAYAWDAANQLVSVTDNRLGGMTTAAYTATGRPASLAQPNGVGVSYAYDSLDRVMSMAWKKTSAPPFASWAYTYSQRGQRLTSTEVTGRAAAYGYDAASRLTSETITNGPSGNDGALTYVLDSVGNRRSRASTLPGLGAQSFSYDPNDELTSDGYDLNGNTTSSGGHIYAYDFENRLVSKDGDAVTLVYDGDGNRIEKAVGGASTQYLVDDLNPTGYLQVLDEISSGAVQARYTYGNTLVSQTQNVSNAPVSSFYGYDAHGNIAFLADLAGGVADTYSYDAWGNLLGQSGSTPNTRLYDGEEVDPDLGLINLRARTYLSGTGRFLTMDPVMIDSKPPLSSNNYLYANVDPVNRRDPLGLFDLGEEGLLLAAETAPALLPTVVAATAGGTVGAAGVVLGNKIACEFQDAADNSAALQGEKEPVRVDPACPETICDCHAEVIIPPSQEHRRGRDIPKLIKGRGKGDDQPAAEIRCRQDVREKLSWHPANTGDNPPVLTVGTIEIDVCFPSLR